MSVSNERSDVPGFHRFGGPAEYSLSVIISVVITLSRDSA